MAHYLKQLTKLSRKFWISQLWLTSARTNSNVTGELICGKLPHRSLLQVKGKDASAFLQGLITNDMRHFDIYETEAKHDDTANQGGVKPSSTLKSVTGAQNSMYSMLLNAKGQILYDLLIYNLGHRPYTPPTNFLLECDIKAKDELIKYLKRYILRKKVDVTDMSEEYIIWVICKPLPEEATLEEAQNLTVPEIEVEHPKKICCFTRDPRTQTLGYRLILPKATTPKMVLKNFNLDEQDITSQYFQLRLKLGIWEGIDEISPAECYPLECNADYMHGVSFHKGCYVGQELTARTFHTGVIRKRVMPIMFDYDDKDSSIEKWTTIENELGRSVGRFITKFGRFGLAQIRIQEALHSSLIRVKGYNGKLQAVRPFWWPVEQQHK